MEAVGRTWVAELIGGELRVSANPLFYADGEKHVIRIDHITGMEFRPAGLLSSGHLKLLGPGIHRPLANLWMRQPYLLDFARRQQPQFEALKDAISARLNQASSPSPADQPPPAP